MKSTNINAKSNYNDFTVFLQKYDS